MWIVAIVHDMRSGKNIIFQKGPLIGFLDTHYKENGLNPIPRFRHQILISTKPRAHSYYYLQTSLHSLTQPHCFPCDPLPKNHIGQWSSWPKTLTCNRILSQTFNLIGSHKNRQSSNCQQCTLIQEYCDTSHLRLVIGRKIQNTL